MRMRPALALAFFSASAAVFAATSPIATKSADQEPRIYGMTEVDQKPEVKSGGPATLPPWLSEAEASVAVLVDVDGTVVRVQLAKTSDKRFGENAMEAAKKYLFKPAIKDGVPVRCVMLLPFGVRKRTEIR